MPLLLSPLCCTRCLLLLMWHSGNGTPWPPNPPPITHAGRARRRLPSLAYHSLDHHLLLLHPAAQLLCCLGGTFVDFMRWVHPCAPTLLAASLRRSFLLGCSESATGGGQLPFLCRRGCSHVYGPAYFPSIPFTCRSLNNLHLHLSLGMPGFISPEFLVEDVSVHTAPITVCTAAVYTLRAGQ